MLIYGECMSLFLHVIFQVGHQHLGASATLGISLYRDATNELICHSIPVYGNGTEPGNEKVRAKFEYNKDCVVAWVLYFSSRSCNNWVNAVELFTWTTFLSSVDVLQGYLVAMTPCTFGGVGMPRPPRLRRNDVVRIESYYNNTEAHWGVMSLFIIQVHEVPLAPIRYGQDNLYLNYRSSNDAWRLAFGRTKLDNLAEFLEH